MSIKKYAFLAALIAASTSSAYAAGMNAGIVHFTGDIIEPSCVIDGDSGVDNNVPLGTYLTTLFTDIGAVSPLKDFRIKLKDCPLKTTGLPQVQLTFEGTTALTGSKTLLDVSQIATTGGTAATGVGIAVSKKGTPDTRLTMDGAENQIFIDLPTGSTDTVMVDLQARYVSFAKTVTAGPADADMTVNIIYH